MDAPLLYPPVHYTDEDQGTWQILLRRFADMIPKHMCREYLQGFERMQFPMDDIPLLADMDRRLHALSGWRIRRVNGIVPDAEFYGSFARRIFPSNDFLRARKDIDYTPAPDIFHEIVGHVPMLTHPLFAGFTRKIGQFALKVLAASGTGSLVPLARIYWFSLEFGLIETPQGPKILGAGFAPGEMQHALTDQVTMRPFLIDEVAMFPYNYWEMQNTLFVIKDLDDLNHQFDRWAGRFNPDTDWGVNPTEGEARNPC
jgi:phenylalanine-4-hydroxylase